MKKFFKIVVLVLLLLFVVLLVRTFLVRSRQIQASVVDKIDLDSNAIVDRLAQALRIQTISHDDASRSNPEEFVRFHEFLRTSFPLIHSRLSLEKIKEFSLLYRWQGLQEDLQPVVWMAHMDVVPAESTTWKHPAFSGDIADGYVWGRGALDDKASLVSQLEGVEYMLQKGFQPKRTFYFAFGHDEETGGEGAAEIANLLQSRGIKPAMVVDEGGAILNALIPGLVVPAAMIGTSEKGYLTLELKIQDSGGHSSAPPKHTAIGILSDAILRLENNPMPAKLEGSAVQMMDYLGAELPFTARFVLSNRWLFDPLITFGLTQDSVARGMVRTTTAVTMIRGGVKENVLPHEATATVNFRIRPGETMEDVVQHVRKTIANEKIEIIRRPMGMNPSPVSSPESPEFQLMHRTIREVFPGVIVVPGMVIGATDARHYAKLSSNVFRFAPFSVTVEDFRGVHGTDERIRSDVYVNMVRFYVQLLKNTN